MEIPNDVRAGNVEGNCVNCHEPTEDSDHEWYCSDECKRENESPRRSYNGTAEGVWPNPELNET